MKTGVGGMMRVGVTAAFMIPLLVWVVMLRRSRSVIRELNAGLEKHVEERTAMQPICWSHVGYPFRRCMQTFIT